MARGTEGSEATATRSGRSRRESMVGAAGALGIAAVGALSRATPALAGTDGDVVLGTFNDATTATWVTNTVSGGASDAAFVGFMSIGSGAGLSGGSANGDGVRGDAGAGGVGVSGTSSAGDGVLGTVSSSANGVHGQNTNSSAAGFGVFAEHIGGGVAIQGNSLSPSSTSITPTGVLGLGQRGVWGLALSGGTGVLASQALEHRRRAGGGRPGYLHPERDREHRRRKDFGDCDGCVDDHLEPGAGNRAEQCGGLCGVRRAERHWEFFLHPPQQGRPYGKNRACRLVRRQLNRRDDTGASGRS